MKNNNKKNAFILMALVVGFMFSISFVSAACNDVFTTGDLRDCCDVYQEAECMGGERTCNSDTDCVYCHSPISAQKDPGYPHTNTDGNYCLYSPDTSNACTCLDPNICMCADQIWGGEACRYLYNYNEDEGFLTRECTPEHYDACEEVSGPLCRLNGGVCSFECDEGWEDCDNNPNNGCEHQKELVCDPHFYNNCDVTDGCGFTKPVFHYPYNICDLDLDIKCGTETENLYCSPDCCSDTIDNDCDGLFNCDDPDCSDDPVCAGESPGEEREARGKLERLYISRVFDGMEKKITISQIRKRSSPKDDIRLDARLYNINTQMSDVSLYNSWNVIEYSSFQGGEQHLLLNMTETDLMEKTWQFFSSIRLK